jgi:hypothetical protein
MYDTTHVLVPPCSFTRNPTGLYTFNLTRISPRESLSSSMIKGGIVASGRIREESMRSGKRKRPAGQAERGQRGNEDGKWWREWRCHAGQRLHTRIGKDIAPTRSRNKHVCMAYEATAGAWVCSSGLVPG